MIRSVANARVVRVEYDAASRALVLKVGSAAIARVDSCDAGIVLDPAHTDAQWLVEPSDDFVVPPALTDHSAPRA